MTSDYLWKLFLKTWLKKLAGSWSSNQSLLSPPASVWDTSHFCQFLGAGGHFKAPPTAPLPASPSNRTTAPEAASSHVALSPEKCLPVWTRERQGNSRQVSFPHPCKAVEETEEPFGQGAACDSSFLALTQSGCSLPSNESPLGNTRHREHQPPPGYHCGPLFFIRAKRR